MVTRNRLTDCVCTAFSVNNWIAGKGYSGTLTPLPGHLQQRVTEEHGVANMMKQHVCNRTADTVYTLSTVVNGWITGL